MALLMIAGLVGFALSAYFGGKPDTPVIVSTLIVSAAWFGILPLHSAFMTGFITNGSEYNGKEMEEIILRPAFKGVNPRTMGIRVVFGIKSSMKRTFFGPLTKILKKYQDGFQGGRKSPKKQKKWTVEEFKAEAEYSKQDYKNTILEYINVGGKKQNDIEGTDVINAERAVFFNGIMSDVFRIFWLADKSKKIVNNGYKVDKTGDATFDSDGVYQTASGGDDVNYNVIDGVWKQIMDDVGFGADKIKRITISNGTTAQSIEQTLSGTTAGTISITINSRQYDEAFDTDVNTTVTNWFNSHAATLAALDITVTNPSAAKLKIESAVAGQPYLLAMTSAGTGGTWTASNSVANVTAQSLPTDEALSIFKQMVEGAPKELLDMANVLPRENENGMPGVTPLRFYVSDSMLYNYLDTLETDGTEAAHTLMIDGVKRYTYRGIPIITPGWDYHLTSDFVSPYPHRAVLTIPENLQLGLNSEGEFSETRFWFNEDENKNRQRTQFEMGAGYILPELMIVAY